ncbi:MAG: ATP F0F1 synthase subunit B [Rhodobacteraceae bacterium]|nr:ATP F0F1 synthase subunit B [Paracoccaceae bacterium]MAY46874.1 ATP F0F1 synthase subunit B [Paracoccaceae bacterium]
MRKILAPAFTTAVTAAVTLAVASPAFAASDAFFSLDNTNFVVSIAFLVFLGVLVYFKVPGMIGQLLDKRAETIQTELVEARTLREEAQTLLASYERKQSQVQEQADRIVEAAKADAQAAADQAKADLEKSIARRLAAADEQIASAQAAAVKDVRDRAIAVAISVARAEMARQMSGADATAMIDASIEEVGAKLH